MTIPETTLGPTVTPDVFQFWAYIEITGHNRIAGKVVSTSIGSAPLLRVDVPNPDGTIRYSRFLSPAAIFSIQPTTQEWVVQYAKDYLQSSPLPWVSDAAAKMDPYAIPEAVEVRLEDDGE